MKRFVALVFAVGIAAPSIVIGQRATPILGQKLPLNEIIKKAGVRRAEYMEAFKDLRANETQISEEHNDSGVKRRREIVSDLFIYQSAIDEKSTVEYRNVLSVDGRQIGDGERRAAQLFDRLSKSKSLATELQTIDKESRRYDLDVSFYGYTLNQGLSLDPLVSPSFRFTILAEDLINGHAVIALQYQQIATLPYEAFKLSLPRRLQNAVPLYRGRMWLDCDTFRLRREQQELTLNLPLAEAPIPIIKWDLNYGDSEFDILTPTGFEFIGFTRGRETTKPYPELLMSSKLTFRYGAFTRFEVKSDYKQSQNRERK